MVYLYSITKTLFEKKVVKPEKIENLKENNEDKNYPMT